MELSQIRKQWARPVNSKPANAAAWDSMAACFSGSMTLPDWDGNPFLRQLRDEVPLTRETTVLDIGCGTGAYALALAEKVRRVVGIDVSPKMLEHAQKHARMRGIENVSFRCADFSDAAIGEKYDLVFAHMTPAVSDAAAFEKMLACSAGSCYLVKPVHRTDSVYDRLKEIAGGPGGPESFDRGMLYAFTMLWQTGRLPTLRYRPETWEMAKTMEEARGWYLNRLKAYGTLDGAAEKRAADYLNGIADENGIVHETVHTVIATMGWNMNMEKAGDGAAIAYRD